MELDDETRKQIPILIASLKMRLEQIKNSKEFNDKVYEKLTKTTCPLCKSMKSSLGMLTNQSCVKCIADRPQTCICPDFVDKVGEAWLEADGRKKLISWLNYQIRKWEKKLNAIQ